jgi:DMSO/TMAO reductase YedYZ heme-binding membrane subunit
MRPEDALNALQGHLQDNQGNPSGPRWKHRRRLVYVATGLAIFMILFGMATFWWDRQVSAEAIISGTAILTVVLGAYLGTATWDDVRLHKEPMHDEYDRNADG